MSRLIERVGGGINRIDIEYVSPSGENPLSSPLVTLGNIDVCIVFPCVKVLGAWRVINPSSTFLLDSTTSALEV